VLARRIYGDAAGVVAAGTYALLSIVPETVGLAAHATHFVMLPALVGIVRLQNLDDHTPAFAHFFRWAAHRAGGFDETIGCGVRPFCCRLDCEMRAGMGSKSAAAAGNAPGLAGVGWVTAAGFDVPDSGDEG
jgi:hypothetical protein